MHDSNFITENSFLPEIPKLGSLSCAATHWLWPHMIAEGAFTILSGEPGAMKSYLALSLAIGLSNGRLWGLECPRKPVLYVDRENPLSMVKDRSLRLLEEADEILLSYWGMWVDKEPPPISSIIYEDIAKKYKPLMIFDSLVRFHNKKENDSGEMGQITPFFRNFCFKGATVVLLHHRGKPSLEGPASPYRGASEIAAACDIGFAVVKTTRQGGARLTLECFKNRFQAEKDIKFQFDSERGLFTPDDLPELDTIALLIKKKLEQRPDLSTQSLSAAINVGEEAVRLTLSKWEGALWAKTERNKKFLWNLISI